MIRTELELKQAIPELEKYQDQIKLEAAKLAEEGFSAEEIQRATQPVQSFAAKLKAEIDEYQRLKRGEIESGKLEDFDELGLLLIRHRIASGLTQKQFAEKLGVDESQVSRDERNEYHGVTTTRLKKLFDALSVDVQAKMIRRAKVVPAN